MFRMDEVLRGLFRCIIFHGVYQADSWHDMCKDFPNPKP